MSLAQYELVEAAARGGRSANVVHGCDMRDGRLACGTATGTILVLEIPPSRSEQSNPPASGAGGASAGEAALDISDGPAAAAIIELRGHAKVCSFLSLSAGALRLFTASLDKSVRLWSLPDGACLQTIKAGTPVLQLALLPADAPAGTERVLLGCGDGTVRNWDPSCKKEKKALTTLRFVHREYVGELRTTSDGDRLLSCSRDGALQLWKRDAKAGFVPEPEAKPAAELADYWRVNLLPHGLVGINTRGGVHLWRKGASAPAVLVEDGLSSTLLDSPADSVAWNDEAEAMRAAATPAITTAAGANTTTADATAETTTDAVSPKPPMLIAFLGMRLAAGGSGGRNGGGTTLELHVLRCKVPAADAGSDAPPSAPSVDQGGGASGSAAASAAGGWERWHSVADDEGVTIDAALQKRLSLMEEVAHKAGRQLEESTVRAFIRKCIEKSVG